MVPAPVGFQCPECVRSHTKATRQNAARFGGERSPNPRTTSIVLIGINVVIWAVLQLAQLIHQQSALVFILGMQPQGMCSATDSPGSYYAGITRLQCEALANGHWVPGVADGAWWQIFTSIFTHVAIWHIAMNCLTLWFLGPPLESFLGRARFLTTYLVSGLFGSLAVYWFSAPNSVSYGGSGALFGLMGALLIVFWRQKADVKQLLMWLALNIMFTFIGGASISWQAHLGGLVGGVIIACVWVFTIHTRRIERIQWSLIAVLIILIGLGMVARTMQLA